MTLEQEIYTQLLELYLNDLEVENLGLHLQVVAFQTIKNYPVVPPVQPVSPYPYPWNPNTVWCSVDNREYSDGSV